ncbi:MAG: hypothetical protein IJQ07_09200 [Clostridia bacterium]|nr:hypothetical protein [Clostridia bacterium]
MTYKQDILIYKSSDEDIFYKTLTSKKKKYIMCVNTRTSFQGDNYGKKRRYACKNSTKKI